MSSGWRRAESTSAFPRPNEWRLDRVRSKQGIWWARMSLQSSSGWRGCWLQSRLWLLSPLRQRRKSWRGIKTLFLMSGKYVLEITTWARDQYGFYIFPKNIDLRWIPERRVRFAEQNSLTCEQHFLPQWGEPSRGWEETAVSTQGPAERKVSWKGWGEFVEKGTHKKLQQVQPRGASQQDHSFCKAPTSKSLQTQKKLA